jgi:hypothetical protein
MKKFSNMMTFKKENQRSMEVSRNNTAEEKENHYSCYLYVGSLVQDQLEQRAIKYPSGSYKPSMVTIQS